MANNPLIQIRKNELSDYKPDKMPVGFAVGMDKSFSRSEIEYLNGDLFYLSTDGIYDQFGGEQGKKLKYRNFCTLLKNNASLSLKEQKTQIEKEFEKYSKGYEQLDDIALIGFKL